MLKFLLQSKISECLTEGKRYVGSNIFFSCNIQNEPGQRPIETPGAGAPFKEHLHLCFYTLWVAYWLHTKAFSIVFMLSEATKQAIFCLKGKSTVCIWTLIIMDYFTRTQLLFLSKVIGLYFKWY